MINYLPSSRISYWQVFRLVFVLFSFYLLFDALYRWSGFRFYSTFSEFLPGLVLITILWSILSAITTFFLWFPLRTIELISFHNRWSKTDRLLLFLYTFSSLAAITLIGKREFVHVALTCQLKLPVFSGVVLITLLLVVVIERFSIHTKWKNIERLLLFIYTFVLTGMLIWFGNHLILHDLSTAFQLLIIISIIIASIALLYSDNAGRWIGIIQDKITIWVWLFSIWLLLSIPIVAYHAWLKNPYTEVLHNFNQSPTTQKDRPNIILVTFDGLSSLDMSAYGYHRPTTPFISEWSKEASLFKRVKSAANSTAPTTSSLVTSKRIWNHRVFQAHGYIIDKGETENIPRLLKQNGYYNMGYMSTEYTIVDGSSIKSLFDIYQSPIMFKKNLNFWGHVDRRLNMLFGKNIRLYDWIIKEDFILGKFLSIVNETLLGGSSLFFYRDSDSFYDIEKQFNKILEDIDNDPTEPFFAWTHLFIPHAAPFLSPEPYKGIFETFLQLEENNLSKEAIKHNDIQIERARYDELLRYCDEKFKQFIEDLRIRNKIKNTVIILSSDHGMKSDYKVPDTSGLTELVTNIPLIIKEPNSEERQIIDDLVEQIDIPATILDLAHIPLPDWIEGRSLVPLMRGKSLTAKPVFSMIFVDNKRLEHIDKGVIAVWEGDYKLINYLKVGKSELFNLKKDPEELNNLFDKEPEVSQRLLKLIQYNLKRANERFSTESDKSIL